MTFRFRNWAQPLLTLAAFGAGCAVVSATTRLAAEGASPFAAGVAGCVAGAALVAASAMLSTGAPGAELDVAADAEEQERQARFAAAAATLNAHIGDILAEARDDLDKAAPSTETEKRADADWNEVASGEDGLRRNAASDVEIIEESR